jgi:hypothetical protein
MTEYHVVWAIDLDAESPADAARKALTIQRKRDSIATVFTVAAMPAGAGLEIDLTEESDEETAPTYQVATATGVSRAAFSPSGQIWEWTPRDATDYSSLAEAIAAAEAIPSADGLLVQLCRYPAPDPQTAPCMAQRIGRNAWRHDGRDLTSLSELLGELLGAAPQ